VTNSLIYAMLIFQGHSRLFVIVFLIAQKLFLISCIRKVFGLQHSNLFYL